MTYYFRFSIPTMPDWKRIAYPAGWFGEMKQCPKNAKGLLYNDRDGYGIGMADDIFIPKEVKVISKEEAEKELKEASAKEREIHTKPDYATNLTAFGEKANIWWGEKLKNRELKTPA